MFAYPCAPTKEELLVWGQTEDAVVPVEDFDLMITLSTDEAVEFVLDERMTRNGKNYFLSYLCMRLGEYLRADNTTEVKNFINKYQEHPSPLIRQVCKRLEEAGSPFCYNYWCFGGLANELLPPL